MVLVLTRSTGLSPIPASTVSIATHVSALSNGNAIVEMHEAFLTTSKAKLFSTGHREENRGSIATAARTGSYATKVACHNSLQNWHIDVDQVGLDQRSVLLRSCRTWTFIAFYAEFRASCRSHKIPRYVRWDGTGRMLAPANPTIPAAVTATLRRPTSGSTAIRKT